MNFLEIPTSYKEKLGLQWHMLFLFWLKNIEYGYSYRGNSSEHQ